jgi:hypothetical protein
VLGYQAAASQRDEPGGCLAAEAGETTWFLATPGTAKEEGGPSPGPPGCVYLCVFVLLGVAELALGGL